MQLHDLKGMGPKRLEQMQQAGIHSVPELLWQLPRTYIDTTQPQPISTLRPGQMVCVAIRLLSSPKLQYLRGLSVVRAQGEDISGRIGLVWFNQPWQKALATQAGILLMYGRVASYKGQMSLQNAVRLTTQGILPRYAPIGQIPPKVVGTLVAQCLAHIQNLVTDLIPPLLMERWGLTGLHEALLQAHQPQSMAALSVAKRRLAFENLLMYQLALKTLHKENTPGIVIAHTPATTRRLWQQCGFEPTLAQERALGSILGDLASGKAMRRLVQGDVGSGKTAVAFGAALAVKDAGYQCALMVPTEVLARQHYRSAQELLAPLGVRCGLLLGGMKAAQRREALQSMSDGTWDLVVGTQALFSEGVKYRNLALAITDEQHRFGVRQRQRLADKAQELAVHVLVMSATPIPRTLSLILFGDLQVSLIDEMPPGREPVSTRIVPEEKRDAMYAFLRGKVAQGEQAYLVCPLVEESEQIEAKDAKHMYETLQRGALKGLRLGLTWGSQPQEEKEAVLAAFSGGAIDVLVATTVIEVGVNVPKATVMVVENAERFGLSQLHQLRGRVGRGGGESWCFLMGEPNERLQIICQSNDGFYIAQKDLELRGPGDFLGTRQSGRLLPDAYGAADMHLLEETRSAAADVIASPALRGAAQPLIDAAIQKYAPLLREIALH